MVKKFVLVFLALFVIFAIVGCGDNLPGTGANPGTGPGPVKSKLTVPQTIELKENTWSTGYYASVDVPVGKTNKKILKDDEWTLAITFTVSRNVPEGIQIGLVDTVTDYWNPLSWDGEAKKGEAGAMFQTEALEKDKEYTLKQVFKALKDSGGTTPAHNKLQFQTDGEYLRAEADNGKSIDAAKNPGPVTITITKGGTTGGDKGGSTEPKTLYENGVWVGATATVSVDGSNTVIVFDGIDVSKFTTLYIETKSALDYVGGSIEGHPSGSYEWVNNQYWSGFTGVDGTYSGGLTGDSGTVVTLKKIVFNISIENVEAIWLE